MSLFRTLNPQDEEYKDNVEKIYRSVRLGGVLSSSEEASINVIMEELDTKIEEHRRAMVSLEEIRIRYVSLFTPVRRLPAEVLALIFIYDARNRPNIIKGDRISHSKVGTLGLVCARWRRVLLTTPQVWGAILLQISFSDPLSSHTLRALECHIEWSGAFPMIVELSVSGGDVHGGRGMHTGHLKLLETMVQQSSRWSELCITVSSSTAAEAILQLLEPKADSFSQLRSLKVAQYDRTMRTQLLEVFQRAPNLDKVEIISRLSFSSVELTTTSFPLRNLTSLCLHGTEKAASEALRTCSMLESIHLVFKIGEKPHAQTNEVVHPSDPIHLPRLRSLTLEAMKTNTISRNNTHPFVGTQRLIASLTCPALKALSFFSYFSQDDVGRDEDTPYDRSRFLGVVAEFILHSGISLEVFRMMGVPVTASNFARFIDCIYQVSELYLGEAEESSTRYSSDIGDDREDLNELVTSDFLLYLTEQNSANPVFPNLKHLSLRVYNDWRENRFEGLLESLAFNGLTSAYLDVVDSKVSLLNLDRLRKLQKRGIAVRVVETLSADWEGWDVENDPEMVVLGYEVDRS
ncbi:hypothetical protein Moror_2150 [Moniliophthora roreri MCA 2997]|uniref:Uncharacterized protein n=1 Tax=Moniliophthora roreri (strain MCA 2997) TaxID=1381753 RepID=V2WA66_MONRO|nr:hypothetical protein Moror_2150 [Moniliophthora roreri MCA 2997]